MNGHVLNYSFLSYFRLNLWLLFIILYIIVENGVFVGSGILSIILLILVVVVDANTCILLLRGLAALLCSAS